MANQITDNRTLVVNADSLTNWVAEGGSTALDTDVKIQGTGSIAEQITNSRRQILYNTGAAQNWANNVFYIWINCGVVGLLATKANGGFTIRFTGPTTTNYFEAYVGGSDSWPTAIAGGWVQFVVDIETARSTAVTNGWTGGTPPATSAIQHIGYSAVTATVMTKVADNTWIDEIRRLPDGSAGIIVEGRNGGSTDWNFANILTQVTTASGTIKEGAAGSYIINTPIQFGINDTSTHGFTDTNKFIFWDNQEFAPSDLYKLSALGNSGGTTNITLGIKTGTGASATGAQGVIFAAASAGVRWAMDFDDANLNAVNLYGCTFIHGGDFQLDNPVVSVISSSYIDCTSATISNSQQLRISVIDANTADGVAFMTTDDISDITSSSFEFSDGHAIELTTPRVATQTSAGNTFIGFGDTATNDAAVYNNTSGAVTINVTSGDSPTYRNGTSASTTVASSASIIINIVDDEGTTITQSCEVTVVKNSDTSILFEEDNITDGTTTYSYSSGGGTVTYINVLNVTGYQPKTVNNVTLPSSGSTTITIQLDDDPFYANP